MNLGVQIALGGLVVAGVGAGAYFLLKPKEEKAQATTRAASNLESVSRNPNNLTPSPSPQTGYSSNPNQSNGLPPSALLGNQTVSQDTALILQQQQQLRAEQERSRLESEARAQADRDRLKRDEIRGFEDRAAAVENLMMIDLTQIQSIERDNSRLNDFQQIAYRELFDTEQWKIEVGKCQKAVHDGCGAVDPFWGCRNGQLWKCDSREVQDIWSKANNPAAYWAIPESKRIAAEELAKWKYNEKVPALARLAERERTYQGIVLELKNRFGVIYNPRSPEAHLKAIIKETAPVVNKPR